MDVAGGLRTEITIHQFVLNLPGEVVRRRFDYQPIASFCEQHYTVWRYHTKLLSRFVRISDEVMFTLNQPVFVIIESLTRRSLWSLMHAVDHRERDDALAVEFNGLQGDVVDGDRLLSIRHFSVPAHVSLRYGSSSNRFHTFARDIHELLSMRASPDTRALPDTCTLPDTCALSYTHAFPDTCVLPYTRAVPDTCVLPDTCASSNTHALPDTHASPYTCVLLNTRALPNTLASPNTRALSNTHASPSWLRFSSFSM